MQLDFLFFNHAISFSYQGKLIIIFCTSKKNSNFVTVKLRKECNLLEMSVG